MPRLYDVPMFPMNGKYFINTEYKPLNPTGLEIQIQHVSGTVNQEIFVRSFIFSKLFECSAFLKLKKNDRNGCGILRCLGTPLAVMFSKGDSFQNCLCLLNWRTMSSQNGVNS